MKNLPWIRTKIGLFLVLFILGTCFISIPSLADGYYGPVIEPTFDIDIGEIDIDIAEYFRTPTDF